MVSKKLLGLLLVMAGAISGYSQNKHVLFVNEGKAGLLDENLNVVIKPEKILIEDYDSFLVSYRYPSTAELLNDKLETLYTAYSVRDYYPVSKDYFYFNGSSRCLVNVNTGEAIKTNQSFNQCKNFRIVPDGNYIAGNTTYYDPKDLSQEYLKDKTLWKVFPFKDGRALLMTDFMMFSVVDDKMNIIRDDIIDCSETYSDGLLAVKTKDGKSGFIDISGEYVFETDFFIDEMDYNPKSMPKLKTYFYDGYACVYTKKNQWKIYDKAGRSTVLDGKYQVEDSFIGEGLLSVFVEKDGKKLYGFVNTNGQEIIPCVFSQVSSYKNGYARVVYDEKFGIIDKNGNIYYSQDLVKGIKSPAKLK